MIKLNIPTVSPAILSTIGTSRNNINCADYSSNSSSYDSGKLTFSFKPPNDIYNDKTIKNALIAAQHHKCCYCETKCLVSEYGAVEHYRPKGAIQKKKSKKTYPGYYWLAYEWSNLLFVCTRCNTRKNSYFPLSHSGVRAINHSGSIINELPLLINPSVSDPKVHFIFHDEVIVGISPEGIETIECIDLNRDDLGEDRRRELGLLVDLAERAIYLYEQGDVANLQKAFDLIRKSISDTAKYSAMNNFYINSLLTKPAFASF